MENRLFSPGRSAGNSQKQQHVEQDFAASFKADSNRRNFLYATGSVWMVFVIFQQLSQ